MAKVIAEQPNGVEENLLPDKRAVAEEYYRSKGIGSSAVERYEHFRNDPKLRQSIFYNVNYSSESDKDVSRLALLEWTLWGWNGEI